MPRIYDYPCSSTTECHSIPVALNPGKYLIECYGAQGGKGLANSEQLCPGGKGAYASGILDLKQRTTFHLYIGGKGQDGVNSLRQSALGGWNGGGNSGKDTGQDSNDAPDTPGGGGGSTDIRMIPAGSEEDDAESTDVTSLNSRLIVAAGGSGSCYNAYGAPGGDLTGYKVNALALESYYEVTISTSQTGKGDDGKDSAYAPSSGSGGGYYEGIASSAADSKYSYAAVSSSGTSYVAGHPSLSDFSAALGSVFENQLLYPKIFNGFSKFPSLNYEKTKAYEEGHEGNGAIKITRIDLCTACTYRRSNIVLLTLILLILSKKM